MFETILKQKMLYKKLAPNKMVEHEDRMTPERFTMATHVITTLRQDVTKDGVGTGRRNSSASEQNSCPVLAMTA
jgi:hypothetical protein